MVRILLYLNILLTLPFGIAALVNPDGLFSEFGLFLDAAGSLVARGYGATLVGFGTSLLLLRKTTDPGVVRSLVVALFLFNLIEATIQGIAGLHGVAHTVIFLNVSLHGSVAVTCLVALIGKAS